MYSYQPESTSRSFEAVFPSSGWDSLKHGAEDTFISLQDEELLDPLVSFYDGINPRNGNPSDVWALSNCPIGYTDEFGFAMNTELADETEFSSSPFHGEVEDTLKDVSISSLPFEQRLEVTAKKLQESMKRSQETRKFLAVNTVTMQQTRRSSVDHILTHVQESTQQLKAHLSTMEVSFRT